MTKKTGAAFSHPSTHLAERRSLREPLSPPPEERSIPAKKTQAPLTRVRAARKAATAPRPRRHPRLRISVVSPPQRGIERWVVPGCAVARRAPGYRREWLRPTWSGPSCWPQFPVSGTVMAYAEASPPVPAREVYASTRKRSAACLRLRPGPSDGPRVAGCSGGPDLVWCSPRIFPAADRPRLAGARRRADAGRARPLGRHARPPCRRPSRSRKWGLGRLGVRGRSCWLSEVRRVHERPRHHDHLGRCRKLVGGVLTDGERPPAAGDVSRVVSKKHLNRQRSRRLLVWGRVLAGLLRLPRVLREESPPRVLSPVSGRPQPCSPRSLGPSRDPASRTFLDRWPSGCARSRPGGRGTRRSTCGGPPADRGRWNHAFCFRFERHESRRPVRSQRGRLARNTSTRTKGDDRNSAPRNVRRLFLQGFAVSTSGFRAHPAVAEHSGPLKSH